MIIGGDFIIPLNPKIDTSAGKFSAPGGTRKQIPRKFYELQLVDIWRTVHAGVRDYTFFSNHHQLYSHIDLIIVPHQILSLVIDITIVHITWSDHTPVMIRFSLGEVTYSTEWKWHLNESLLQIPEIWEDLGREITTYFQINDIVGSDSRIVWEAHKVVIWGF